MLYQDLWDSKQPGIFFFYRVAGALFGFDEIGIHLFELFYLIGFAVVLLVTGRGFLRTRAARLALPLLVVALYYLVARSKYMTQVEVLIGPPIYLAAWFAIRGAHGRISSFLSGICGAIVVWFKLAFLPVVFAIWGFALWCRYRENPFAVAAGHAGALAAGSLLPVVALVLWAVGSGVWEEFWWTSFVYPFESAKTPVLLDRIEDVLIWFVSFFALPLLFAVVGLWRTRSRKEERNWLYGCLVWFGVALLLVILERWWWKYYLLLLSVPLGVLGAYGVDCALQATGRGRKILVRCAIAVTLVIPIGHLVEKMIPLARHGWAIDAEERERFQIDFQSQRAGWMEQVEILRSRIDPDDEIYVFGSPSILLQAGRQNAIPIHGWSAEVWSTEIWMRVADQLREARPRYIFFSTHNRRMIEQRHWSLYNEINEEYRTFRKTYTGVWLTLRRP